MFPLLQKPMISDEGWPWDLKIEDENEVGFDHLNIAVAQCLARTVVTA